jgi:hypothetical protein
MEFEVLPLSAIPDVARHLWPMRTTISKRKRFGTPMLDRGLTWYEFQELYSSKLRTPLTIAFANVATHNQFVLDHSGKVFNSTAPVIKLSQRASEDEHLGLIGLLNSSAACFWLKQVCHNKGLRGIGGGITAEAWEQFMQVNGSRVELFPLATERPLELTRALTFEAHRFTVNLPAAICNRMVPTREALDAARREIGAARVRMIALQEELDWRCYRYYGLHERPPEHPDPPPLRLGERAFEIVMARRMATGDLETAWFERHRSTPITDLPAHWPGDYRAVVQRRIEMIETNATISLIERPEYKRRWSAEPWEKLEGDALRDWLLDRLEDARYWPATEPRLISTHTLADGVRSDADFLSVAVLCAGEGALNLEALVAKMVTRESVPFLAPLRYSETGLRKRGDWEATWEKQRQEDQIEVEVTQRERRRQEPTWAEMQPKRACENASANDPRMQAKLSNRDYVAHLNHAIQSEVKRRKQEEIGTIPVPPKYKQADFLSDFWRLRGGLDVPKERFVSFPHCARDADGSLPVLWAGYDHLARAKAIAAWYVERKDADGWPAPRLTPLLVGLLELIPWLRQWHNDVDPATGLRMGDYFADFIDDECRSLGLNQADLRQWKPPAPARRQRGRRAAA